MNLEHWKTFLESIQDYLITGNISTFIKIHHSTLKSTNLELFKDWENDNFDLNHLFATAGEVKEKTLLLIATEIGNLDLVKILINGGAQINKTSNDGYSPLHAASKNGHLEILLFLLKNGAEINQTSSIEGTSLHCGSNNGHSEIVKTLLSKGAVRGINPGAVDPLHLATLKGHLNVVKAFLENGVDPNSCCSNGFTLLHMAAAGGHLEIIKFLLKNGADVQKLDKVDGVTPLHLAAQYGRLNVIKHLLEETQLNFTALSNNGDTLLHYSCIGPSTLLVNFLEGKNVFRKLYSPLEALKKNDFFKHIPTEFYVNFNEIKTLNHTNIEYNLETVKFLVEEKGIAVNSENNQGCTPLNFAIESGQTVVVKYLLDERETKINVDNILHLAVNSGRVEMVKYLVENKQIKNTLNFQGGAINKKARTPLHQSISMGYLDISECLINNGADVNLFDSMQRTPLITASGGGNFQIIKLLINRGADVNISDTSKTNPLHAAIRFGDLNIVKFFIDEMHVDFTAVTVEGYTPLYIACMNNHLDIVKYLVDGKRVDCTVPDEWNGWTPLYLAISNEGDIDMIKYLVDKGTNVNVLTKRNRTALSMACYKGKLDIVKYLLEDKSAYLNNIDRFNGTALHAAVQQGNLHVVKYLLEGRQDVDTNLKLKGGQTILHLAVHSNNYDMVKYFLEEKNMGHLINTARTDFYWTPLHEAVAKGNCKIVEYLLNHNASLNSVDRFGNTPLQLAVQRKEYEVSKILKKINDINNLMSVQSNAKCDSSYSPFSKNNNSFHKDHSCTTKQFNSNEKEILHDAITKGNICMLKQVIKEMGENVNFKDNFGYTILCIAIDYDQSDIVKYLTDEKNVNISFKDTSGRTILHYSAQKGNFELVKYLVNEKKMRPQINLRRVDNRWTVLHEAASQGHTEIATFLLYNGAILNSFDISGNTPLHLAVMAGFEDTVKLFLDKGANLNPKNKEGLTPLQCAERENKKYLVKLFIERQLKKNVSV